MRRRFFVERFDGRAAVLRGEAAHHLARVLRAAPGQVYELSDGRALWLARVARAGRAEVAFELVEPLPAREPRLRVALLLAVVKFDRFEWCLEKATELGVAEVIPVAAARSEKRLVESAAKRAARWERILRESAQQARCLAPPRLAAMARPREAFAAAAHVHELSILLSERREAPPVKRVLAGKSGATAALAIGPEGGWTDEEFAAAREARWLEASLGENILRTETAVIAALTAVTYALGD
jgi:16S rRNA (uracil1498-N3)-methyltransferase